MVVCSASAEQRAPECCYAKQQTKACGEFERVGSIKVIVGRSETTQGKVDAHVKAADVKWRKRRVLFDAALP